MSIATQLTALANNRDAIKAAIEAKGVADAGDTLAEFPAAIASIPSGGGHAVACVGYSGMGGQAFWLTVDGVRKYYGNIYSFSNSVSIDAEYSWDATIQYSDGTSESFMERDTAYTLPTDKDAFISHWHVTCLLAGTKISLVDGTTKNIDDISYNDELLIWDFDEGKFASTKPLWIKKAQAVDYMYVIKFASGNSIKVTGPKGHRAFNIGESSFVYLNDSVGQKVKTIDGEDEVVSCEKKNGNFDFYNIITNRHFNMFANGILTSCRLNNYRKFDGMKFAESPKVYHTKEDFKGIPDSYVEGLRLCEQPIDLKELPRYVANLIHNQKIEAAI